MIIFADTMKRIALILSSFAALLTGVCSCEKLPYNGDDFDTVVIYYGGGYNNLSSSIATNINELCTGAIPDMKSHNALLAFCHNTGSYGDYTTPHSPVLVRLYQGKNGVVRDTLTVFPADTKSIDENTVNAVLTSIKKDFPAQHYGMLFSSHATGWIPPGYTTKEEESAYATTASVTSRESHPAGVYENIPQDSDLPETKSIGAQYYQSGSYAYQMELAAFARAIPMKLDYIIFDACLMGCIEVAYELRNVCGRIVASPTEILKRGFIYEPMAERLFRYPADLQGICNDYYRYYMDEASEKSATIALYDCSKVEAVAKDMAAIIEAHREDLATVNRNKVQRYFYTNTSEPKHWFYDLRDIAANINATTSELAALDADMKAMVPYKATTGRFFDIEIPESKYSGVSMYLPNGSWDTLNTYYKTLGWNNKVNLVK